MILIAGRYDVARRFARENQLGPGLPNWSHVGSYQQLRGLVGPKRNPKSPHELIRVWHEPGYFGCPDEEFDDLIEMLGF